MALVRCLLAHPIFVDQSVLLLELISSHKIHNNFGSTYHTAVVPLQHEGTIHTSEQV